MATSCSYITHELMESFVCQNRNRDNDQHLLKTNSKSMIKDNKLPKEGDDKMLDAPLDYSG